MTTETTSIFDQPLGFLDLHPRVYKLLMGFRSGTIFKTVGPLVYWNRGQLIAKVSGFGPKACDDLERQLKQHGLKLAMSKAEVEKIRGVEETNRAQEHNRKQRVEEIRERLNPKTLFDHDCSDCIPIGMLMGEDIYICNQGGNIPTIVARYSSMPHDYSSGKSTVLQKPMPLPATVKAYLRLMLV